MSELIILCGLIGSGKTTYANKIYKVVTDLDYMSPDSRKIDQIMLTLDLLKTNDTVCHITCYPTELEDLAFKGLKPKMIFIDTSINQCKINILTRNRERDMNNLNGVLSANVKYDNKVQLNRHRFEFINVFEEKL